MINYIVQRITIRKHQKRSLRPDKCKKQQQNKSTDKSELTQITICINTVNFILTLVNQKIRTNTYEVWISSETGMTPIFILLFYLIFNRRHQDGGGGTTTKVGKMLYVHEERRWSSCQIQNKTAFSFREIKSNG